MKSFFILIQLFSILFAAIINIPDDYPTIQEGIDATSNGDTVIVHPGTYSENIILSGHDIILGSFFVTIEDTSYVAQTIIDGDLSGAVIVSNPGISNNTRIIGLTIENGSGKIIDETRTTRGGGIYAVNSSPQIRNCTVRSNIATEGSAFFATGSYAIFHKCSFVNNEGSATVIANWSGITMDSCVVMNNIGEGIYSYASPSVFTNTIVRGNSGVAMRFDENSSVRDCMFIDNGGPVALWSGVLDHCLVTGGLNEGVIIWWGSTAEIENSTIVGNGTYGLYNYGDGAIIHNSIIRENGIVPIQHHYESAYSVINYSNIDSEIILGEGNINEVPSFVDPNNSDFSLQHTSPCIDAGDPDPQYNDPDGTRNDMGAYYFHQYSYGCTSIEAVNYDPMAEVDDGSCIYLDDIEPHFYPIWSGMPTNPMGFYISSATIDEIDLRVGDEIGIFDGDICVGLAQLESEIVPDLQIFASQDNPNTEEQDGFLNGNDIHYRFWDASEGIELINVFADVTDGSNLFQSLGFTNANLSVDFIQGCTDAIAGNYNPEATVDDGSCFYPTYGCIDESACNFDAEANTDDGTCLYFDCTGDCGGVAYPDDCGVCDDNSENDNECIGCTDPWALNYEPVYTIDDGSCLYPGMGDLNGDSDINIVDVVELIFIILEGEEYVFFMDLNGDSYLNIIDVVIIVDIILNPWLLGCTDPLASNYNPNAIYDDGSCDLCVDIDGNTYAVVQIGNQLWMAENLKVTHYNNGDDIPTDYSNDQWISLTTGAYAIYDDVPDNTEIYGNLYNWRAVDDERGICPEDWHVATSGDWLQLTDYLGSSVGSKLAGDADLWNTGPLTEDSTFATSGFNAFPGGYRYHWYGYYSNIGNMSCFWTSTPTSHPNYPSNRIILHSGTGITSSYGNFPYRTGFSVRCLHD